MIMLIVIQAVLAIVAALIVYVFGQITFPPMLTEALRYGLTAMIDGIQFMAILLPSSFWNFCFALLSLLFAAHVAYIALTTGFSFWRYYNGGK